jgi:hypothetical protein
LKTQNQTAAGVLIPPRPIFISLVQALRRPLPSPNKA